MFVLRTQFVTAVVVICATFRVGEALPLPFHLPRALALPENVVLLDAQTGAVRVSVPSILAAAETNSTAHHGPFVSVHGTDDSVTVGGKKMAQTRHHHADDESIIVNGDHKDVHGNEPSRRGLARRENYIPGIVNVVKDGSPSNVASLVMDASNMSAPMFMASPHNASEIRLVFVAPDDFAAANLSQAALGPSEVPVRMEIDAFNPVSAITGALGGVITTLCGTLSGPLGGVLSMIGLDLCPADAASMSSAQTFAYDTGTGVIRQLQAAPAPDTVNAASGSGNEGGMKLVFVPSDVKISADKTHQRRAASGFFSPSLRR